MNGESERDQSMPATALLAIDKVCEAFESRVESRQGTTTGAVLGSCCGDDSAGTLAGTKAPRRRVSHTLPHSTRCRPRPASGLQVRF